MGAALAALALLALPSAAHAQGATLDGAPLNVFADGLGAIQVRVDGLAAGLFYDPTENPAHAGLEIKEGERVYPLQDGFSTTPGRVSAGPTLTDLGGGTQRLHAEYLVGPNLRVAEDHAYTNGASQIDVRYAITEHLGRPDLDPGRCARRPLRRQQRQRQRRDPPREPALRRRPRRGLGARLRPAGDHAVGGAAGGRLRLVFSNFAGDGLNGTVDSEAPDNGVGVSWQLDNLAPGETRAIDAAGCSPPRRRPGPCRRRPSSPTPMA